MNPASTIISDVKITGTLEFSESLFLDCQFQGDILSNGKLTIGEHGKVEGQINAESVIVLGQVKGSIIVTNSCKIQSTATLLGDMKAPRLEISEGAVIQGNITVPFPQQNVPTSAPETSEEEEAPGETEGEDNTPEKGIQEESKLEENVKPDKK